MFYIVLVERSGTKSIFEYFCHSLRFLVISVAGSMNLEWIDFVNSFITGFEYVLGLVWLAVLFFPLVSSSTFISRFFLSVIRLERNGYLHSSAHYILFRFDVVPSVILFSFT